MPESELKGRCIGIIFDTQIYCTANLKKKVIILQPKFPHTLAQTGVHVTKILTKKYIRQNTRAVDPLTGLIEVGWNR